MRKKAFAFILFILLVKLLPAQTCINTGQTPSSAILLCGSASYSQNTVPLCGVSPVPTPCPATSTYENTNPTWFRLNCFSSGTLGFTIVPNDPDENFDWQLFDVSGRNDDDVFTDPSLFLACNWCPDAGITGATADGTNAVVCAQTTGELFSSMPNIIQGHEYLLLVVHRNPTTQGFQIFLSGGSGSVTDPVEPSIVVARLSCNSTQIAVYINKEIFCNSIAPDGSDFELSNGASITSAVFSCASGRTGLVLLNLSNAISPGLYSLKMKHGFDGNTVVDRCSREIPVGHSVPLTIHAPVPTTMDSLTPPACSPDVLRLVFRQPIQCNSVALNGSDFTIVGPQAVNIGNVTLSCNTQTVTTTSISLGLSSPIIAGGTYQIFLNAGTDGNTLVDECGAMLQPASIQFTVQESVSADFTYTIKASCKEDTIYFSNASPGVTNWNWSFDNTPGTNAPNQVKIYPAKGDHNIRLIVSNSNCKDTAFESISLDNQVIADFELPSTFCPEDPVVAENKSTGTVDQWLWSFGNNITSNVQSPQPFHYPITGRETFYLVKLVAANNAMNCKDSISKRIQVLSNCYIAVPSAFTPNGDGLNDFLNPNNAVKAQNLLFRVYNRQGQIVFETRDWTRKWDGRIRGEMQQTGVYAWTLNYTHRDTGEKVFQKGTTVLIR